MSEVGRLIADRYRLTEHIGSGAMGVVWQAHDERLHRTVALKQLLLQPGLSAAEAHEARERAMREGRIAARLQHPNAVAVYDVVEDAGQPVLIMEYVPSKSLSAVLDERGPLAPSEVARIGAQVATALTAAHAAGIVHRDIKPGNVLLADDGTVKITDFGISRATGDVTVTATGMLAGTPAYLAPEVAKGENPGPPSDVFSLASTVYAAVEGHPPFGVGENTLAILHAVAACRTQPPRKAGPLTAPLMQMLRPNPNDRPTMAEVTRALNAVATGSAVPTLGPGTGPTAMVEQGPPMPRPDLRAEPSTVRTWQPQQPPMTPAGGYAVRAPADYPAAGGPPWRRRLITAAAIIAAALVGILVANMFVNTSGSQSSTGQIGSDVNPSVANQPLPSPLSTFTPSAGAPAPSGANPPPGPENGTPTFAAMASTLNAYVSLLPGQPDQAFQLLTPAEQARSGGQTAYEQTWSQVKLVHLGSIPLPHGANEVTAHVIVVDDTNKITDVNYTFQFVNDNGNVLINNIVAGGTKQRHDQ